MTLESISELGIQSPTRFGELLQNNLQEGNPWVINLDLGLIGIETAAARGKAVTRFKHHLEATNSPFYLHPFDSVGNLVVDSSEFGDRPPEEYLYEMRWRMLID